MTKFCVVCGYPNLTDNEACSDSCIRKLVLVREIAAQKRRTSNLKLKNKKDLSAKAADHITKNFARILLEQNVPVYISSTDLDREICKENDWLCKLNRSYRKRCITNNIVAVGYVWNSFAHRGKSIYRLAEDREVLREKLETIVLSGRSIG